MNQRQTGANSLPTVKFNPISTDGCSYWTPSEREMEVCRIVEQLFEAVAKEPSVMSQRSDSFQW